MWYDTHAVIVVGKGRGRQVIAVARTADLILMMLDAGKQLCRSTLGYSLGVVRRWEGCSLQMIS